MPRTASGVLVEWAVAEEPLPGELESGDAALVVEAAQGVLLAGVDALGHGPIAAAVASTARTALAREPGRPLDTVMGDCHAALVGSRGAAVTLARLDVAGLTWLAVGNVTGVLVHAAGGEASRQVPLRGGIVGAGMPRLRNVDHLPLEPGDMVVLATDGVRTGFTRCVRAGGDVQELADSLLHEHARGTDDALVLVARYLGKARP